MSTQSFGTPIDQVFLLESLQFEDERGSFLNVYRRNNLSFVDCWGDLPVNQINLSTTSIVGTVRGLHCQSASSAEKKIVRCIAGRVWDVAVDLRPHSNTFGSWFGLELSADAGNALVIPEGCAHGFQVLKPSSQLLYIHSGAWTPNDEIGVHCEDPELAIDWPLPVTNLSNRDQSLKSFTELFDQSY